MAFRLDTYATDTNGTTWEEIVPAPDAGTRRAVRNISAYNADSGNSVYTFAKYDGSTYWIVHKTGTIATVTSWGLAEDLPGAFWFLKPGWSMVVKLGGAAAANESQIVTDWADDIEEKESTS